MLSESNTTYRAVNAFIKMINNEGQTLEELKKIQFDLSNMSSVPFDWLDGILYHSKVEWIVVKTLASEALEFNLEQQLKINKKQK